MSTVQPKGSLGKASGKFSIHEENESEYHGRATTGQRASILNPGSNSADNPAPLTTSKLGNQQSQPGSRAPSFYKKQKLDHSASASQSATHPSPVDQILAQLSEKQTLLHKQKKALKSVDDGQVAHIDNDSSSNGSVQLTPATDSFNITPNSEGNADETVQLDAAELARLKHELNAAKDKIARQEQELSQTRVIKHTFDQAMGPPSEMDYHHNGDVTEHTISSLQSAFNASSRPLSDRQDAWGVQDDAQSDISDALSAGAYNRAHGIWANPARPGYGIDLAAPINQHYNANTNQWGQEAARAWPSRPQTQVPPALMLPRHQPQHGTYTGPPTPVYGGDGRLMNDFNQFQTPQGLRRPITQSNRMGPAYTQRNTNLGTYASSISSGDGMTSNSTFQSMGAYQGPVGYQPRPIGTPLSPTAAEFTAVHNSPTPWNSQAPTLPAQTYVSPMEPLNYRRLLDRTVTCNWKYIVDKIVCNNDQQASIFLQQKLKVGTIEQKYEIVEAIVAQAYPLMVNRFGNFLVQRCFEHGTPEQVIAIANAIRGNTLNLSMDAFGCHVVQKAFDSVPEDYKAIMVHELLRRIPETVIHRYACHVWQKLFELRWSDSPPQIMKYVNEALRGMWHEVALGETGSLVVQNIFENCLEEDKRPCINEVLASIDIVAHGQFGNWCIQHICEHGLPADRSHAISHVLCYATEYSMDQFASKVVEKCLKIGGPDFLERYLARVCEGRSDRPRIPLIDIASDQYGNYLIQYILTHSNPQHRDIVATHIRKHMVSLRGSKFGSRVGMLCCNPASATRPGPAFAPPVNRFGSNNRFNGPFR